MRGASQRYPWPARCRDACQDGRSCLSNEHANNGRMSPNPNALEARLRRVELELAELKAALAPQPVTRWYREVVGSFAGDKTLAKIVRLVG